MLAHGLLLLRADETGQSRRGSKEENGLATSNKVIISCHCQSAAGIDLICLHCSPEETVVSQPPANAYRTLWDRRKPNFSDKVDHLVE